MTLPITFALFLATAALAGFSAWRGSRPPDLVRGPRMVPWRFVMMLSAAVGLALLVHIANLVGIQTGQGRFGR
jgi:hypothetical protein